MDSRTHWEKIYGEKAPNAVSWYRPHLETSLSLIERVASRDSAIIEVGGGESTLVDDLLSHGHENVTVLDVSQTAIDANKTQHIVPGAFYARSRKKLEVVLVISFVDCISVGQIQRKLRADAKAGGN